MTPFPLSVSGESEFTKGREGLTEWQEAFSVYINQSRWSLYQIEVLSHHFCSQAPFERAGAPGYEPCLASLRDAGLIDGDKNVTTLGVRFIAALCDTPIPDAALSLSTSGERT